MGVASHPNTGEEAEGGNREGEERVLLASPPSTSRDAARKSFPVLDPRRVPLAARPSWRWRSSAADTGCALLPRGRVSSPPIEVPIHALRVLRVQASRERIESTRWWAEVVSGVVILLPALDPGGYTMDHDGVSEKEGMEGILALLTALCFGRFSLGFLENGCSAAWRSLSDKAPQCILLCTATRDSGGRGRDGCSGKGGGRRSDAPEDEREDSAEERESSRGGGGGGRRPPPVEEAAAALLGPSPRRVGAYGRDAAGA